MNKSPERTGSKLKSRLNRTARVWLAGSAIAGFSVSGAEAKPAAGVNLGSLERQTAAQIEAEQPVDAFNGTLVIKNMIYNPKKHKKVPFYRGITYPLISFIGKPTDRNTQTFDPNNYVYGSISRGNSTEAIVTYHKLGPNMTLMGNSYAPGQSFVQTNILFPRTKGSFDFNHPVTSADGLSTHGGPLLDASGHPEAVGLEYIPAKEEIPGSISL